MEMPKNLKTIGIRLLELEEILEKPSGSLSINSKKKEVIIK
jgi:hypothetical protein